MRFEAQLDGLPGTVYDPAAITVPAVTVKVLPHPAVPRSVRACWN
jgi:hypothetical protein